MSRIDVPLGGPYPGRLRLTGTPPPGPAVARTFRLSGPRFDAPRIGALARAVGLNGPVKRMTDYESVGSQRVRSEWNVVSRGGLPSHQPLKSIAVSRRSGQLIYHDFGLDIGQGPANSSPPQAGSIAAARSWLTRLGWPATHMPLSSARVFPSPPRVAQIVLDWPGVGPTDIPAAIIWVVPGGRIAEALVLPPVASTTSVRTTSSSKVWRAVTGGKYPIGVENMIVQYPPNGSGTLTSSGITHVFDSAPGGLYLLPAYRFSGTARFPSITGPRTWFALVPAYSG